MRRFTVNLLLMGEKRDTSILALSSSARSLPPVRRLLIDFREACYNVLYLANVTVISSISITKQRRRLAELLSARRRAVERRRFRDGDEEHEESRAKAKGRKRQGLGGGGMVGKGGS